MAIHKKPLQLLKQPSLWPILIWVSLLRLLVLLPYRWQLRIGAGFGWLLSHLARERRQVTHTNLYLCFPDLTDAEHQKMFNAVFRHNGIGLMEAAMAWWAPESWFKQRVTLKGKEHLDAALAQGKGVIMLGAHFSTLDLGGLLFSFYYPLNTLYRPNNNPLLDRIIYNGRARFTQNIDRSDFRSVIRKLKNNEIIWYAPDQDFGMKQSVFVPFFGVPAATLTATTRLAKLNDSPILMLAQHRTANGQYELELYPAIESFPTGNLQDDACLINQAIETAIRKDPAQYMWVHRRFKSQKKNKNYLYRQPPKTESKEP